MIIRHYGNPKNWVDAEEVKKFVQEVLIEMDHLNEKFEAIAMRCNVETMAGDDFCVNSETEDKDGKE